MADGNPPSSVHVVIRAAVDAETWDLGEARLAEDSYQRELAALLRAIADEMENPT
jgi:hypothetical protein